jgi:hypothetical protein
MTFPRPYAAQLTVPEAIAELRQGADTQFDPDVVDTLATLTAGPPRAAMDAWCWRHIAAATCGAVLRTVDVPAHPGVPPRSPVDQVAGSCTTDRMLPSGSLNQAPRMPPSSAMPLTVFSPGRS